MCPRDVTPGRGTLSRDVDGRALVLWVPLVIGVSGRERRTGFFNAVSFFNWETLLAPFILAFDALAGRAGCTSSQEG